MYSVVDSTLQFKMLNAWNNSGELMVSNGEGDYKELNEKLEPILLGTYSKGIKTGEWVYYQAGN